MNFTPMTNDKYSIGKDILDKTRLSSPQNNSIVQMK